MKIVILDLDNCISDDRWRQHHIGTKGRRNFHEYHCRSGSDSLANEHVLETGDAKIVVVTGRPEKYRTITKGWLEKHNIKVHSLHMRGNKDYRPSQEYKRQVAQELQELGHSIVAAYDDLPRVVQAYKEIGIEGAQVVAVEPREEA